MWEGFHGSSKTDQLVAHTRGGEYSEAWVPREGEATWLGSTLATLYMASADEWVMNHLSGSLSVQLLQCHSPLQLGYTASPAFTATTGTKERGEGGAGLRYRTDRWTEQCSWECVSGDWGREGAGRGEWQGVAAQPALQGRRQCLLWASLGGGQGRGDKDSASTRDLTYKTSL